MAQKTLKKLALIIAASALCAGLSSCQKDADEKGGFTTGGDGKITFGMSFGKASDDLTVKGSLDLKDVTGATLLNMYEEVTDTPSPMQTKSELIDESNFYDYFYVSGFSINEESGLEPYSDIVNLQVKENGQTFPGGKEIWSLVGTSKSWPAGKNLEFFACVPDEGILSKASFAHEMIAFTGYEIPKALDHKDLMFAHYYGLGNDNTLGKSGAVNDVATLEFSHALSSVKFKAAEGLTGFTINSIKLEGVGKTASCTASFGDATTYVWAAPTATTDYTKPFDPPIEPSALEASLGTFLVIPQTFGASSTARIVLNITRGDVTSNISYKLYDSSRPEGAQETEWNAGQLYTYIISTGGELDIQVREEFLENNIKKDVKVENTGKKASYVRMSIVANWVDGQGNIIRPCNWMTTGTLVGKAWGEESDKWVLGDDGWFYYKNVLKPGPSIYTQELFTEYNPGLPQFSGTKLMMEVMAQGVEFDDTKAHVTAAWGEAAATLLTKNFDD